MIKLYQLVGIEWLHAVRGNAKRSTVMASKAVIIATGGIGGSVAEFEIMPVRGHRVGLGVSSGVGLGLGVSMGVSSRVGAGVGSGIGSGVGAGRVSARVGLGIGLEVGAGVSAGVGSGIGLGVGFEVSVCSGKDVSGKSMSAYIFGLCCVSTLRDTVSFLSVVLCCAW